MGINEWSVERLARLGLANLPLGQGAWAAIRLASMFPEAEEAWRRLRDGQVDVPLLFGENAEAVIARANQIDPETQATRTENAGLRFLIPSDSEWPTSINDDLFGLGVIDPGGMPVGLWVKGPGDLAGWSSNSVAMVGSRAATGYGEAVAGTMASEVARDGTRTVISGGAFGIDTASHRGALSENGRTIAVLSRGIDWPYPSTLFDTIAEQGLLVSEYPPGVTVSRTAVSQRNRLIAAMSQGVVVVEGSANSGAVNVVGWAEALHRPVMAVPGPVTSANSALPNQLIQDQRAILVKDASDVTLRLSHAADAPTVGIAPVIDLNPAELQPKQAGSFPINDSAIHDVVCTRDGDGVHVNVDQVIVDSSPSGFEFGYKGSGPSDLALNILAPAIGEEDARRLHLQFRDDLIATIPRQGGTITAAQIHGWLDKAQQADGYGVGVPFDQPKLTPSQPDLTARAVEMVDKWLAALKDDPEVRRITDLPSATQLRRDAVVALHAADNAGLGDQTEQQLSAKLGESTGAVLVDQLRHEGVYGMTRPATTGQSRDRTPDEPYPQPQLATPGQPRLML